MEPWWIPPLREVVGGRDVVIAGAVPAAWVDHVVHLRAAGARSILVAATEGRGAGTGPDVPTVVVEPPVELADMERLRWAQRALDDPPEELRTALDRFDPRGDAVVVGSFLNSSPDLAGRPFVAHRRPEWIALEDKVIVDEFWDRAGIDRLPAAVVPLEDAAAVAPTIDRGAGTVWAADAREGFHGAGTHTHWVPDAASVDGVVTRLESVCDRVRVMPFVDGIPCSIHGIVLPDGVAVLRPVETVTLRRGHELVYTGCATYWDPPPRVRTQMREVARRVGRRLAAEVGFRGTFTVDGVVARDGFWPTELNPRFGAGINVIASADGDVPIMLLNDLIVAGRSIGVTAATLEAELLGRADEHRGGGTYQPVGEVADASGDARFDGREWRWCASDEPADAEVVARNRFVRCRFRRAPIGPSVGARAAAFWDFADRQLGTSMGPLRPAPDLRP